MKKHGYSAEYARFVKIAHANLAKILNGTTQSLRQTTVDAICTAERIREEELLSISKGHSSDGGNDSEEICSDLQEGTVIRIRNPEVESFTLKQCAQLDLYPSEYVNQLIRKFGKDLQAEGVENRPLMRMDVFEFFNPVRFDRRWKPLPEHLLLRRFLPEHLLPERVRQRIRVGRPL